MAKKGTLHRSYALVYLDEALLFVRKTGEEKFHLPSVSPSGIRRKKNMIKKAYAEYGLTGKIVRALPEIVSYDEQGGILQHAFVYQAQLPEKIVGYEYLFLNEGDPELQDVNEESKRLANRAFLYAPLYLEKPRTVPLLPPEDEKAYWELRCLKYFRKKIPSAEIQEFEALIYSAASMRRINAAFVGLCNIYQVNPKTFVAYLEYREKRRKALQ